MTENFKTSETDELFRVKSIKVPFAGGSYQEINNIIIVALNNNPDLRLIIRGLDCGMFFDDKDRMRDELGTFPNYLYDINPFNDVCYLYNKDVIFSRVYSMYLKTKEDNFIPGITSFDDYSRWQDRYSFGVNTVAPDGVEFKGHGNPVHLSETDRLKIFENITQNVTSITDKYNTVAFYYFFTPHSILWYKDKVENGTIYKQIEAEEYVIELLLDHSNVKLFSFNNQNFITDLNNYRDTSHYADWINSLILRFMNTDRCFLTKDNYKSYLNEEFILIYNYDYDSLNEQVDYENDYKAFEVLENLYFNK